MTFAALGAMPLVFGVIFLAELPDKTTLTSLALATRQPPLWVWLGAAVGFLGQTALAVAAGSLLARVPHDVVRVASGVCFLVFAVLMWRRRGDADLSAAAKAEEQAANGMFRVVGQAAVLIFLAEFGDLTQFTIAALQARLNAAVVVFVASWLGLVSAAFLAVVAGSRLARLLDPVRLQRASALILAALGAAVLLGLNVGGV